MVIRLAQERGDRYKIACGVTQANGQRALGACSTLCSACTQQEMMKGSV